MRRQFHSIKRKTTAIIMLATVAVVLLTALGFTLHDLVAYRRNLIAMFSATAAIIADHSASAVATHNREDAQATLTSLRANPRIAEATLYDRQGTLFAHYPAQTLPTAYPQRVLGPQHWFEGPAWWWWSR